MPLRDVMIRLGLNTSPFIAGVKQAQLASAGLANDITKTAAGGSRSAAVLGSSFGLIGLAAGAAGAKMISAAADFDQGMSNVKATGADAVKNIGALRQAAIDAGNATKYSATEAAGGIEALAKAGVSSADVLGGGLKGALSLAAAGNLDVAGSAEAAASAMNQFGLAGKDVPHIADLLAAGAGKAQGEVSDMAQALNQAGLIAHGAGASIEETTGTLAAFASAGLIGSDAGTSFKTMLQRLQVPMGQAGPLMEQLGIHAYDAQGNFAGLATIAGQMANGPMKNLTQEQRAAALATIFGSDAVRAANVLYEQGEGGIKKWTRAVDDSGYAADTAKTKMDNLKGDLETLKGTLDTVFISGGEGPNKGLRPLIQGLNDLILKVTEADRVMKRSQASQFDFLAAPFRKGRAAGLEGPTGVDRKVIYRLEVLGEQASVASLTRVANAANLTPREVRTVLQALGWDPGKIDAVVGSLRRAQQEARVRAQLELAGFSTNKIDAVVDALSGAQSKAKVKAQLTLSGFSPKQIQAILTLLDDVGKKNPKPKTDLKDNATTPLKGINAMLLGLDGKKATVTVTTVRRTVSKPAGGGALEGGTLHGFADGGYWGQRAAGAISGPGTDTSDSIPAMLSNGEHVLTASDVRKLGGQDAVFALRSDIQGGRFKYADGGPSAIQASRLTSPPRSLSLSPIQVSFRSVTIDAANSGLSFVAVAEDAAGRVLAEHIYETRWED